MPERSRRPREANALVAEIVRAVCQRELGCAPLGPEGPAMRCRSPASSSPTPGPSRLLRNQSRLSRARNVRLVIRYQGSATIQQGRTVVEGECVVDSGGDRLAEPDLPWSGRFHDSAPVASLEEGRAWLRL